MNSTHCLHYPHLLRIIKTLLFFFCLQAIVTSILFWGNAHGAYAEETIPSSVHIVKRGDTLGGIAQHYKISIKQLRQWNKLPGNKILVGQRLDIRSGSSFRYYGVKSGDTLSEIAVQSGISVPALRSLNNISRDRIYTGQRLKIGVSRNAQKPAATSHVVKKGESLWRIAARYHLDISDLKKFNRLETDDITPGMALKLVEPTEDEAEDEETVEEQFEYTVKAGDSLSTIAQRFDVGLGLLRQLNGLKTNQIYPGQTLQLRPSSLDEAVHVVRSGETLSSIALKYRMELNELININGIEGSKIIVGEKLRLKTTPQHVHMVERGDALWEVARAYGLTVADIKKLNGLTSDRIYPGQELQLGVKQSESFDTYTVQTGDTLGGIARLYQMSVAELKKVNNMRTSLIRPGEQLKVSPLLRKEKESLKTRDINWDDLIPSSSGLKKIQAENGPYFGKRPRADRQNHPRYYENASMSLSGTYRQARKLQAAFDGKISKMGRLGDTLKGWHIVLDPGHGGLDPGAVVENMDGNGKKVYVVEDEYVYDIALRVYVLLRLHGATVTLTLLSPNHLIRHSDPPVQTFVNEKNEVYNSPAFNKGNRKTHWPRGGRNGNLSCRVDIARNAFKNVPLKRRIFLSFHADIDHRSPEAPLVIYYRSRNGGYVDQVSKKFATAMLSSMGAGAFTRGQNLGVLRNNPARIKVMLELRNLAYTDHAWALRFEQLRQRDAEKVVRGLIEYAGGKG